MTMWTFEQHSGELYDAQGELIATGYSGFGAGKDNPAAQGEANVGPIPCGTYTIGTLTDVQGGPHGPFVLPLTPAATNAMQHRGGFLIHGDSIDRPGFASHGCVILPRDVRLRLAASGDKQLVVTP